MTRRKSGIGPWFIGIVLGLVVLAIVVGPRLVPVGVLRDPVVAAVHAATGRDLVFNGGMTLALFPNLAVEAKDVSLSNAPWAEGAPMLRVERLDLRLKVLPLFRRRVEIDSFVLDHPVLDLRTDSQGNGNWVFVKPEKPEAVQPSEPSTGDEFPAGLKLGDVQVVKGKLNFTDGATGRSESVEDIDLKVGLSSLDQPLTASGSARWRDKQVDISFNAVDMRELLGQAGSQARLQLASEPFKFGFDGKVSLTGSGNGEGDLDIAVPSVRGLAKWVGGHPSDLPGTGFGPLEAKGHVVFDSGKCRLSRLVASFDAIKATGEMTMDHSGLRPSLVGKLAVERLDLTPYMSIQEPDNAAKNTTGWSEAQLDLSGLKAADADLSVLAGSIAVGKLEVGQTQATLALHDGRLMVELGGAALYQGTVQGRLTLDSSAAAEANFKLDGVQAEPLFAALSDIDAVSGLISAESALTAHGNSERNMIASLAGRGKVTFVNGVIKGVDVVSMVHNAVNAFTGTTADAAKEGTAFTEMGGSYTIADGIVKNDDLTLLSPLLRVSGTGTVDLPKRQVDYRLTPKLASGGQGESGGQLVPVMVSGPWDNLSFRPDLEGLIKQQIEPSKLLKAPAIEKVLPKIKPKRHR